MVRTNSKPLIVILSLILAGVISQNSRASSPAGSSISGVIQKDYAAHELSFDVRIDSGATSLRMWGPAHNQWKVWGSRLDFSGVQVEKSFQGCSGRRAATVRIANKGYFEHYPYQRLFRAATLAGVALDGPLLKDVWTGAIDLSKLDVDGRPAVGRFESNVFNFGGEYFIRNPLEFGSSRLRATRLDQMVVDHDGESARSQTRLALAVDNVKWNGLIDIQYATRLVQYASGASTGSGLNSLRVRVLSRNSLSGRLSHMDGTALQVSCDPKLVTRDENALRHLLALIELLSFDVLADK